MASTDERVKQIIVEQLGVSEEEVTPTAHFVDDLGADSLDQVELVMALEEAFGIEIPMKTRKKSPPSRTPSNTSRSTPPRNNPRQEPVPGAGTAENTGLEPTSRRHRCGTAVRMRHRHRRSLEEHRLRHERRRSITLFDASAHDARIAGEVRGFDPLNWVEKKEIKKMGRFIQFALAGADFAMKMSGLAVTPENSEQVGVYIASGIGGFDVIEREHTQADAGRAGKNLAVLHPRDDHQPGCGPYLHPLRRARAQLRHRYGLLRVRARHRRRLQDHPA